MDSVHRWLIGVFFVATQVGCGWISPPNWWRPGPAAYQRYEAVQFDPYPENGIGPPVVGGRPLGYENPTPEPKRVQTQMPGNRYPP